MKALIIANGTQPTKDLIQKHSDAQILIAADGGIYSADRYGMIPDYIVGDFDSADQNKLGSLHKKTKLIHLEKEKDETDAMIAVDTAVDAGALHIVMLGALGLRTDHAFANLMLIKYAFNKGARLYLEDEYCDVSFATGETLIAGKPGQTVSVMPFGGSATVSSDDSLYYPMDRLFMLPENPVGISNVLKKESARLYIEGFALVFRIK